MSLEIFKKVDSILDVAEVPERHTYFQMKNFIVGKECTLQGQLWQVIREIRARRDSLEALDDQLADLRDNIELVELRIERLQLEKSLEFYLASPVASGFTPIPEEVKSLDAQEKEVLIRKAHREKRALARTHFRLERQSKYLSEEITYLVGAFEVLSKVEALKPLDDIDSQRKYWNEKYQEELNLRLLLKQSIDPDFVRSIMALDENAPVRVQMAAILQNVQNRMIADRDRQKSAQAQIDGLRAAQLPEGEN